MNAKASGLHLAATSYTLIWNGVAAIGERVFVAGPRWTGSTGPSVALVDGGTIIPFPSPAWNGWKPGDDPTNTFVNVNAIHLDSEGGLWAVDTGSPDFGGDPLPGAAKVVRIDLTRGQVDRIYPAGPTMALPGSYIDDIRFNGRHAYLTDAGKPGLIILDLDTGNMRRVLNGHPSVTAPDDRDVIMSGRVIRTADGRPLRVNVDPMEVSPDGKWLYFGSLHGPWSRISTALLDDPAVDASELARHVEPWADLPPVGGTVMDKTGDLYFTDLATCAVCRRSPDGIVTTVVQDERLHWADAPFIDEARRLWLPVPQMDRSSLFVGADRPREWPVCLYWVHLPA